MRYRLIRCTNFTQNVTTSNNFSFVVIKDQEGYMPESICTTNDYMAAITAILNNAGIEVIAEDAGDFINSILDRIKKDSNIKLGIDRGISKGDI